MGTVAEAQSLQYGEPARRCSWPEGRSGCRGCDGGERQGDEGECRVSGQAREAMDDGMAVSGGIEKGRGE